MYSYERETTKVPFIMSFIIFIIKKVKIFQNFFGTYYIQFLINIFNINVQLNSANKSSIITRETQAFP